METTTAAFTFLQSYQHNASPRSKALRIASIRSHTTRFCHERIRSGRRTSVRVRKRTIGSDTKKKNENMLDLNHELAKLVKPPLSLSAPDDVEEFGCNIHVPETVKTYIVLFAPNVRGVCNAFEFAQIWTAELLPLIRRRACLAAFSAVMQSAQDQFDNRHSGREKPSSKVLKFRARAIKYLEQEVGHEDAVDDSTLLSMLFLATSAGRSLNYHERDIHRRAIARLVRNRGGLYNVGDYVRSWLLQFEAFWAAESGFSSLGCPFDFAFDPPLSTIELNIMLPVGFQGLNNASLLSLPVVDAITRTIELLNQDSRPQTPSTSEISSIAWASSRLWDMVYRLSRTNSNEPGIDSLVCVGMILFNYVALSPLRVWHLMSLWGHLGAWARRRLTEKLLMCTVRRSIEEERCLVWLAKLTLGTWQVAGNVLAEEGRLLLVFARARFREAIEDVGGDTEAGLGKMFFHSPKPCFNVSTFFPGRGPAGPLGSNGT